MRAALRLAKKGLGRTSPNPAVGSVIVRDNKIIAGGYHKKAGLPHAEIEALKSAKAPVKGATLYVTLEPCCHFGRTPPCTDAILSSGIKRVVIGMTDPNPKVGGKGVRILRSAGIDVISGVLEEECRGINEGYIKYITTRTPFVTLKLASSLDGRIATDSGESRWITGTASRRLVHRMRSVSDAVMAGSGTVLKDDPELTVRLVKGRNPVRVVLDSVFQVPMGARVFSGIDGSRTIVFTTRSASRDKIKKAEAAGAEVIIVPKSADGVDLKRVLKELGKREITGVLVEGGGRLAASLLKQGLIDKVFLFLAPIFLGKDGVASIGALGIKSLKNAPSLYNMTVKKTGTDILIEGYIKNK